MNDLGNGNLKNTCNWAREHGAYKYKPWEIRWVVEALYWVNQTIHTVMRLK